MTKDLSKQICEKCGIKPKKIDDGGGWYYECYPHLGRPDNFVKLLELPLPWYTKTLWDFITHEYCYCQSTRRTFLHDLKEYITNRYHKFPSEAVERIKQSIREAEWKYE